MCSITSIDFDIELVLHRDGSIVPHPRIITAILGGAAGPVRGGVFNPGLTLSTACPHATIRLMCGETTPAWRNLGEGVSFESHSCHVRGAFDSLDVASRVIEKFSMRTFQASFDE
jgi:hypothetical protein